MTDSIIISKVWNLAHVLRDDGVGYGDYLEQITYLLFLKMADELSKPPNNKVLKFPKLKDVEGKEIKDAEICNWENLSGKKGAELESFYSQLLRSLSTEKGMLGQIFTKSQNKIQDPAKLLKVINLIDQEKWSMISEDIKGKVYEGLLEKNAEDTKSGAGQYFTPRSLIKTMVKCVQPKPMKTIADPACGSGGFFLASYDYIAKNYDLDIEEKEFLKNKTFHGNEIVANTRRMCLMNMFLHNIGEIDGDSYVSSNDALISDDGSRYDYVLANPPFGKKSSMMSTNEVGEIEKEDLNYNRQDFWESTSNKQLNFLQHIKSMLKISGEAAVVLPDNALFEGGAGEEVRKQLMKTTELHTILRLPTGVFYAQGVKANVLFFDNRPASKEAWTKEVWIYDYRTNIHHTLKKKPMLEEDLEEFVKLYNPNNRNKRKETWNDKNSEERWRKFTYEEILARDKTNLDIFWLKDKSLTDLDNLPDPDILANEIIENLESGLNSFKEIMGLLMGKGEISKEVAVEYYEDLLEDILTETEEDRWKDNYDFNREDSPVIQIDEKENAIDSLETALSYLYRNDNLKWKWIVFALHHSLYSFCISCLENGNYENVLSRGYEDDKNVYVQFSGNTIKKSKIVHHYYKEYKTPAYKMIWEDVDSFPENKKGKKISKKPEKLIGFWTALARVQDSYYWMGRMCYSKHLDISEEEFNKITWLIEKVRNDLTHYIPKGYIISIIDVIEACEVIIDKIEFLALESFSILYLNYTRSTERIKECLKEIKLKLEGEKEKYSENDGEENKLDKNEI